MPHLNFTNDDWQRIENNTMAWWFGELERPLVWLSAAPTINSRQTDLSATQPLYNYLSNYPLDLPAEEVVDRHAQMLTATRFYADAFPNLWINFGPGILAGFLGAKVNSVTDPSETVWFSPAENKSIAELDFSLDPANPWWQRVQDITAAAVDRFDGCVAIGHTDLGGNLDVLASFRDTQDLLFDLLDHPEEVERLAGKLTTLWLRCYDEQDALIRPACRGTTCWTPIWSTGKTYMLQSDFAYMISPEMFARFVMPDLIACCEHLDHAFYHLDGKGQIPHLDQLLSIPRLRGIQWIPGDGQPPPDQWLPLLKRIRDGGKLCQIFVSPEGARHIVKNLGGRGFLLVIQADDGDFHNPEEAHAFLRTLEQEDIAGPYQIR